ncbi:MAG: hypothetical protein WBN66_11100 [Smithella sp.]
MKKYVTLILITIGLMIICSCAARQVIEADKKMVKDCEYIGTVSSTFKNPDEGKQYVLEQAAVKGATHAIIHITPEGKKGTGKYSVSARCYRCSESNRSTAP